MNEEYISGTHTSKKSYRVFCLLVLALIFLWQGSHAQEVTELVDLKEEKKNQPKKWQLPAEKPSESVMAAWAPVHVDHYFGVRGGYGLGMGNFEPTRSNVSVMGLLNFGAYYRFDVPSQKFVGSIQADIEYTQRGYAYETYNESGVIYQREFSTIMLAIPWQPYLPLSKGGSRFHLNAGPYFSYALDSYEKLYQEDNGTVLSEGEYVYDGLRDNRMEFGVVVGAGFSFVIAKRFSLGLDARYYFMLSDALKNVTKYPGNPFRSPVNHVNASLTFGFKLTGPNKKNKKDKTPESVQLPQL